MGFLDKLSSSRGGPRKALQIVIALLVVAAFALAGISVFLTYRVVSPARSATEFSPQQLSTPPSTIVFSTPQGDRDGWFFPGLRGAPAVLLAPAYGMNRGHLLTLAVALQEHQYNVFLFEYTAQGGNSGFSSLGSRESGELLAAIDTVAGRDDVDQERFGVWGADVGGYAAICAAATDPRIKAFAVDSVFNTPAQMFHHHLRRTGITGLPLVSRISGWIFTLLNFSARHDAPLSDRVRTMSGIPKFFIQARESAAVESAEATRQLYLAAPEPREQSLIFRSRYAVMSAEERQSYETSIVSFFLQSLPPVQIPGRPATGGR